MGNIYPMRLNHAGAWRVYLGGKRIRALRGEANVQDDHYPEEWIASTTPAAGAGAVPEDGLSRLAERPSLFLRDAIAASPDRFLGRSFVRTYGSHCGVLMKLLDAAERLNVQVHPDRAAAKRLWNSPYGKTECWHFLPGRTIDGRPPVFYLGVREQVTPSDFRKAFESGDPQRLLGCMCAFEAKPGQTVLVESGVPHALGAGCFALEIQEPSDLTLRLERRTASGSVVPDEICHLGAGYDTMFSLIQYDHLSREKLLQKYVMAPKILYAGTNGRIIRLLDETICPYFQMDQVEVVSCLELSAPAQFYGLFVLSGRGQLLCEELRFPLSPGDQFFVPADCPAIRVCADEPLCFIRFSGPRAPA